MSLKFPFVRMSQFVFLTIIAIVMGVSGSRPALGQCPDFNHNTGNWTWMAGSNQANLYGVYGTQNFEAPGNMPGGREAVTGWTGADGSFWMFGGYGYSETQGPPPPLLSASLGDLWKFNPVTGLWTWKKGTKLLNQNGSYGPQYAEGPGYNPGGRYYHMTWTGDDGYLWMFGGVGFSASSSGYLNDLWRYNPTTNNWAYMKGTSLSSQYGVYGTKGTAAIGNRPGCRGRGMTWVDVDGNLWMFGGRGFSISQADVAMNDLWKYDTTNNNWTWVSGANIGNQPGVYGVQGVADINNVPSARAGSATWTDADGNFWLFGGRNGSSKVLNDLWKYNPTTNQWTWVNGTSAIEQLGVYGTLGVADASNTPGSRCFSSTWIDENGDFWLFGGNGYTTTTVFGDLNDMWKYDLSANEWTWVKGTGVVNQRANYGTKGIISTSNLPGARRLGVPWVDDKGHFWMFGGGGWIEAGFGGYLNDVWMFTPGLALTTDEDTPTTYSDHVLDPSGIGVESIIQDPDQGTLKLVTGTTSTLYYVPPPDWFGETTAVLSLIGGSCDETTSLLTITVNPINDPPVITAFNYSPVPACVNQLTSFAAVAYDIDGGPLSYYFDYGDGATSDSAGIHVYTATGFFTATVEVNDGIDYVTSSIPVEVVYPCPGFDVDDWEWIDGDDTTNQPWVSNRPGARQGAASWTGSDGSLWLFGGEGLGGLYGTDVARLGDLWRYDVTSSTWELKNNNTTVSRQLNRRNYYSVTPGTMVYDEPTTATAGPSARVYAMSWVDGNGKFWLFGGYGRGFSHTGYMNDLWKYDPITDVWSCETPAPGPAPPDPSDNKIVSQNGWPTQIPDWPGWRRSGLTWTDATGNLWLFGGRGWSSDGSTSEGYLNDLWKYDVTVGEWAQISGDKQTNALGVYVGDEIHPGGRYNSAGWTDDSGDLWLFGGWGYGSVDAGHLNDLWKFDTSETSWTFVTGGGSVNQFGVYNGPANGLHSGGRHGAAAWLGLDGNLWMFGGWGYGPKEYGQLNDLWKFDISAGAWQCMNRQGDRVFHLPGVYYGPDALRPGGRETPASWITADGSLWLFGGRGFASDMGPDYLSDLWRYGATYAGGTGNAGGIITIPISVIDPAGDATLVVDQQPAHGVVVLDLGTTTTLTYSPNAGFSGRDNAVLKVYNSACGGETATVIFNIIPAPSSRVEDYKYY